MLRLDLQAIPLDVDNPDFLSGSSRASARGPFAVADPDSTAMRVDRLNHDDNLAQEA